MTPKEYLLRYRQLANQIDSKTERVKELREKATNISISMGERVQSSAVGDKTALIVERYLLLESEIIADLDELGQKQSEILTVIESLTDETQKTMLQYRYINGYTLEVIAIKMNYSYMQICRIHGKALEKVKDVIECYT